MHSYCVRDTCHMTFVLRAYDLFTGLWDPYLDFQARASPLVMSPMLGCPGGPNVVPAGPRGAAGRGRGLRSPCASKQAVSKHFEPAYMCY